MLDNHTLFISNAAVALTMALAFYLAGRTSREPYWESWCWSNILICAAMTAMLSEPYLVEFGYVMVANLLLMLGMAFRWKAAREFRDPHAPTSVTFIFPFLFLVVGPILVLAQARTAVFVAVNLALAITSFATANEFRRLKFSQPHPSRKALIVSYVILGVALSLRTLQGAILGQGDSYLPDDGLLTGSLALSLVHLTVSGSLALSLAHERDAQALKLIADQDSLTGLKTRRAFFETIDPRLQSPAMKEYAILLFDLDHFKRLNDRFGHAAGDQALRVAASIIRQTLGDDLPIARWGGEEFVALLPNVSLQVATDTAERARINLRRTPIAFRGHAIEVSVSVGVCHTSDMSRDFDEMMRLADTALYSSKSRGRNRTEVAAS